MRRYVCAVSLLLSFLPGLEVAGQSKHALLIGINNYQPEGTTGQHPIGCAYGSCELGSFENLKGSVNDAQSMADLLTSPKFGFPAGQVVLLTNPAPARSRAGVTILPAQQTTREGILAAMQKYLVDVPQRGDTVVFYFSGHGSLRLNSKGSGISVLTADGKYQHAESTLVPSDAYKGGYDVRYGELTRIFNSASDKGIHLTAILDSSYGGGISQGVGSNSKKHNLAFDPRDIAEPPDKLWNGELRPAPTQRTDNPALVFCGTQQDQAGMEMEISDKVPEPHGAFTAALVEVLQTLPSTTTASEISQMVKEVLEGNGVEDQDPYLDATRNRIQQPLFGGQARDSGKLLTAALKVDDDDGVLLDIGQVAGIGVGSEFTSIGQVGSSEKTVLRITDTESLTLSAAVVVSPSKATVAPGDLFELTKWVQPDSDPLLVWLSPPTLSEDQILAAAKQIKSSGAVSVSDPAEEFWTDILSWDGTSWTLQSAPHSGTKDSVTVGFDKKPIPSIRLGANLTADSLKQFLHPDSRLWVNLPPSKELATKLNLQGGVSAVKETETFASASYILTGVLTEDGPAYAWYHKTEFADGPMSNRTKDHSPGCSTNSQYPVRSDWIALDDVSEADSVGKSLDEYATRLGKVHGWFNLANGVAGASTANYYNLAIVNAVDQTPISSDQLLHRGDRLRMALTAPATVRERRWVYILDIDCRGNGSLIYPTNSSDNRFPGEDEEERFFVLPSSPELRVGPPYGVDSFILLSTAQPLPDPYVLNFEGVAASGTRGTESPLQNLLTNTSLGGKRNISGPIPTDWGISVFPIRSSAEEVTK